METPIDTLAKLPHAPGVYIYKNAQGVVLYVGKARDLKKRVSQYFQREDAIGPKTKLLVAGMSEIQTIKTASEYDALLLEAKLIHDLKPHYNSISKDDKSPIYIVLTTEEELPRVELARKTGLPKVIPRGPVIFGPFQSAFVTRALLRQLRRIIPFCTQKERNGRACFYTHLNLCRPCPSVIAKMPAGEKRTQLVKDYRRNIFRLKALLSGKLVSVRRELEKEMYKQAGDKFFEEAAILKEEIENLSGLKSARFDPTLYITQPTLAADASSLELTALASVLKPYYPTISALERIECYDISNISGTLSTGSLVVLTNAQIDKGEYRKFKIRRKEAPNDTAMMKEVVGRRLKHGEWPRPNLLVVDGGKGQVGAAVQAIHVAKGGPEIPVIGLSKRFEEIVVPVAGGYKIIRLPSVSPAIHLLQRVRDEAHRFAKSYHLLLRSKKLSGV